MRSALAARGKTAEQTRTRQGTCMEKPAVLLLERDATVIDAALESFAGEVEVLVAKTLDLAVRVAARKPPAVVVIDAEMAGTSPAETVFRLRAYAPSSRVVFVAAPGFELDRRYTQLGTVLRKPLTGERLADAIRNALRLQNMSAGVQRMRTSSGTFAAVRPPDPPAASDPVPPANEPRPPSESGEHLRPASAERPRRTSTTPPPFARVR